MKWMRWSWTEYCACPVWLRDHIIGLMVEESNRRKADDARRRMSR